MAKLQKRDFYEAIFGPLQQNIEEDGTGVRHIPKDPGARGGNISFFLVG